MAEENPQTVPETPAQSAPVEPAAPTTAEQAPVEGAMVETEDLDEDEDFDEETDEEGETTEVNEAPETPDPFGPRSIGIMAILLRMLGGLGGGIVGTGVIIAILFLGSSVLQTALGDSGDGTVHPLFVFVFMAMIFLGSTTSNLLGPLFIGLSDRDHYKRLSTSLYQIFISNLVILIVVAPVYMVVSGLNVNMVVSVAALQLVVSAFASAMILEIIADYKYSLLGVYSTAFAVLVSAGVYFFFYTVSSGQALVLLFLALPLMWFSIGLFGSLLNFFYGWIYKLYGVDFLSSVTVYGEDERWTSDAEEEEIAEEKEVEHKGRSETGADFLKGDEPESKSTPQGS
ncbi:MAG: hypothetical protein Q8P27_00600 [Candidatus Peregrinibacteria bacterium]|nr:hypothetical protein [Candidatus Peregrinibacteria bacterium]